MSILGKYLAFQAMDNQIRIMEPLANFRWKSKKLFKGHMVNDFHSKFFVLIIRFRSLVMLVVWIFHRICPI